MFKSFRFVLFCSLFLLASCSQNSGKKETTKETCPYPVPTPEFIAKMQTAESLDYLVRNTNFSISQTEINAVKTTLTTMGTMPVENYNSACTSPIRLTLVGPEGIITDAELYTDCKYQVYLINGKPTYAAQMTPQALSFLNNLLKQANNFSRGQ